MKRSKWIALMIVTLTVIITGGSIYYLLESGSIREDVMKKFSNGFFIFAGIAMLIITTIDYVKIRKDKNKFGEIKYTLLRMDRKKQVSVFKFQVGIVIFMIGVIIIGMLASDEIRLRDLWLPLIMAMQVIMVGIHNNEKEGINEICIYSWGVAIKWERIKSYKIKEDILSLNVEKKVFGKIEKYEIPFKLESENRDEVIALVDMKI